MLRFSGSSFLLSLHLFFGVLGQTRDGFAQTSAAQEASRDVVTTWSASGVQHAYGLPNTKVKEKGTMTVNVEGVTFRGKSNVFTIPRQSVMAVSAGNERVELWGMKGRLLRMAIPNGGGLAAAGVMHHKVGMLTVEFSDGKGGYHGAVFYLPVDEAAHVLRSFSEMPEVHREISNAACKSGVVMPRSVLVAAPEWDQMEVPAAYRALVYEHLVDRLQKMKDAGAVYRDGEPGVQRGCPQFVIHTKISGFKQGSQVQRAVMGPVGMFMGTTQMTFNANITDASGGMNVNEQVKATVRGESESVNVADGVAKNIVKQYSAAQKKYEKDKVVNLSARGR